MIELLCYMHLVETGSSYGNLSIIDKHAHCILEVLSLAVTQQLDKFFSSPGYALTCSYNILIYKLLHRKHSVSFLFKADEYT